MSDEKNTQLALVPRSIQEAESLAILLSKSSLVPEAFRGKPADTFMAIAYGLEIGIPPVCSLRAVTVIKGKPTLYADAMVGLVLASGKAKYFICVESDGQKATYETHRMGAPAPVRKSFSIDDAQKAKLIGSDSAYTKYPRHMLEARAKSHLSRDVYPDLLHGIYSAEEVTEFREEKVRGTPVIHLRPVADDVIDAEVIDEVMPAPMTQTLEEKINGAVALEDLARLLPDLKAVKDEADKSRLRDVYSTVRKRLIQGYASNLKGEVQS